MNHTPGPWLFHLSRNHSFNGGVIADTHGVRIATLSRTADKPYNQKGRDGHLIAAAPELLEAAKLAALTFTRRHDSGDFLGDDDHEAWSALTAAVRKSEGE